jgi:hypothetical protein
LQFGFATPIGLFERDTRTLLQFDFAIQLCYANIK